MFRKIEAKNMLLSLTAYLKERTEELYKVRKFYEKAEKALGYLTTDQRQNYNTIEARIDEVNKFISVIEKVLIGE